MLASRLGVSTEQSYAGKTAGKFEDNSIALREILASDSAKETSGELLSLTCLPASAESERFEASGGRCLHLQWDLNSQKLTAVSDEHPIHGDIAKSMKQKFPI
jgi:hypothetical protein